MLYLKYFHDISVISNKFVQIKHRNVLQFKVLIVLISVAALFSQCSKDEVIDEAAIESLSFSLDTVIFDTVFTQVGTITKNFKIYNNSKNTISISSITLKNELSSNYRINVDGIASNEVTNLKIAGNDSIFVFVEATIDPT